MEEDVKENHTPQKVTTLCFGAFILSLPSGFLTDESLTFGVQTKVAKINFFTVSLDKVLELKDSEANGGDGRPAVLSERRRSHLSGESSATACVQRRTQDSRLSPSTLPTGPPTSSLV